MINSKIFPGVIVVSLLVAALVFSVKQWRQPVLPVKDDSTANTVIKPLSTGEQPVPEEFIELTSQLANDTGNQNFASVPTQTLWENLLAGFHTGKNTQIGLENALIARLRKEPSNGIYNELLAQFRPGILDATAQQVLVSLLGEVANYNAADALMRLVTGGLVHDPDVKLSTFHAISKFSPESWHEHANTELAPVFEAAWQTQDPEYLAAIANVMASIGTASTLDIFIQTLTENTDAERSDIVKQAMTNLVNPALIPKLAALLKTSSENVSLASGDALANMGDINAALEIFIWAKQADASRVDFVKEWSETAMNTTPEFVDYLTENLTKQPFAAPENKQALLGVLNDVTNGVE